MTKIKFGTDGWRGVISEDFTFENVRIVAQAISDYLNQSPITNRRTPKVVVGYDTRFLSNRYAELIAEVLAGNNIEVMLLNKPEPTPAISFLIHKEALSGGVVVTASHNPPHFNGIKFKAHYAGSADPSITRKIEKFLHKSQVKQQPLEEAKRKEKVKVEDAESRYLNFLTSYVDMKLLKNSELKALVDSMHGTADSYFAKALGSTDSQVSTIRSFPHPLFGGVNPEPIPRNLTELRSSIKKDHFDIGIATDGDADRIGAMRPDGRYISSHQIFALLLLHFIEDRNLKGAVVKTITATSLINRIAQKYGLKLYEVPVGFKHICNIMRERDILIGGEESGGIGFKDYIPERDGILAGLLLLEMLSFRKKGIIKIIKEMEKEFGKFRFQRLDLEYPEEKKKRLFYHLKNNPPHRLLRKRIKEIKAFDGIKFICEDDSWLMFRPSGTEPLLRIYAESENLKKVNELIQLGKHLTFNV